MPITPKPSGSPKPHNPCSTIVTLARQAILDEQTICLVYPNGDVVIADAMVAASAI